MFFFFRFLFISESYQALLNILEHYGKDKHVYTRHKRWTRNPIQKGSFDEFRCPQINLSKIFHDWQ